jgi:hypothetical protein
MLESCEWILRCYGQTNSFLVMGFRGPSGLAAVFNKVRVWGKQEVKLRAERERFFKWATLKWERKFCYSCNYLSQTVTRLVTAVKSDLTSEYSRTIETEINYAVSLKDLQFSGWWRFDRVTNLWKSQVLVIASGDNNKLKTTLNSVALVRERTIPTELPALVGEVSAQLLWIEVSRGQPNGFPRPLISVF